MKITVTDERQRMEILDSWPMAKQNGISMVVDSEHDSALINWFRDHLDNFLLVGEEGGLGTLYETKETLAYTKAFQQVVDGGGFVQNFDEIVRHDAYDFGVSVAFYTPWWLGLVHGYLEPRVHDGTIVNRLQLEQEIRTKCEVMLMTGKTIIAQYSH